MAENNLMNLKIFLKDEGASEARRVSVDASVATSFLFMKEKLQTVFPALRNAEFQITWRDTDGDEITIASDEDFITAFTEMSSNVKILTIKVIQRSAEPGLYAYASDDEPVGPLIICDGCNTTITGFRYKCLQCPDFDLCSDCEFKSLHSHHVMVRLPNNENYPTKCNRKFVHHIARNLKKSAHAAHHAAKIASKHKGKCKQTFEHCVPEKEGQGPNCRQHCLFSAKDVHELGILAQEKLADILKPVVATQDQGSKDQGSLLMDAVRNAVDGFFGHYSGNTSDNQPQLEVNIEKNQTNSETQHAPMETEISPSAPIYPILPQQIVNPEPKLIESSPQPVPISQPEENNLHPQWTFVAANNQQPAQNGNQTAQENQPAFIYHENPVIAEGLVKLHEMGFSNETGVLSNLLEHFNGNVTDVVKAIFDRNN